MYRYEKSVDCISEAIRKSKNRTMNIEKKYVCLFSGPVEIADEFSDFPLIEVTN